MSISDGASSQPLVLCVLLWAHEGRHDELSAYEDLVLPLVAEHGGEVLQRMKLVDPGLGPAEVQAIRFGSQKHLDHYMADERRLALASQRDDAVRHTEVLQAIVLP